MSTPARDGLLAMSSRGAAWGVSTQLLGQLLHLGIRIILARLLAPEDFGLVAMVVVFVSFAENVLDLGFGAALVQRRDLIDEHRNTVFWSVGLASCFAAMLFVFGAPLVGRFYGSGEIVPIMRVLGLSLILGFPDAVYRSFFQRDMDFRTLGLRRIGSTVIGGGAGIAAALGGFGVWALIVERLLTVSSSSMWMVLRSPWRPTGVVSWQATGELWHYSRNLVGARLVNYFNRNLDNLLVGKFLGAQSLGIYSFAYQGVVGPLQYLARPLANVAFPAFAKVQNERAVARRAYLETLSGLAVVCMTAVGILFYFSPWIIPLALGSKWSTVVVPFQFLCVVGSLQVLMSLSPSVFNGLGRPDLSFKWTVIALVFNAVGFIIGLRWGVIGVAAGYLLAVLTSTPVHFFLVARLLNLKLRSIALILLRVILVFFSTGVGLLFIDYIPVGQRSDYQLFFSMIMGFSVSIGLSVILIPKGWELIVRSVRSIGQIGVERAPSGKAL
jgi:PST family polysaccharide transporter